MNPGFQIIFIILSLKIISFFIYIKAVGHNLETPKFTETMRNVKTPIFLIFVIQDSHEYYPLECFTDLLIMRHLILDLCKNILKTTRHS